jgi:hypothetical protein
MIAKAAALVAALCLLAGCAMSRSTVDLSRGSTAVPATAQPSQGQAVKIVSVADQRAFKIDPKTPQEPSLKDDNITDKAITSRAIGRKRGGFGLALGDVLLPEGDSVSAHVATALTNGFRQAGYRVLATGDAGYDQATPIQVVIKQYWSWLEVAMSGNLNWRAEIELDSTLPALAPSQTIFSQIAKDAAVIFDSDWVQVNNEGLASLSARLADVLKTRGAGS